MTPTLRQLSIAAAIRQYCIEHPHAGDTLEGISRWWLGDVGPCLLSDVEAAVAVLVDEGMLGRRVLADGSTFYFSHTLG